MPDFSHLLNVKAGEIKTPVPLPAGEYLLTVQSWEQVESGKKGTPGVQVNFVVAAPVNVLGELPEKGVNGKAVRDTFWLTEDALFRLKTFVEHCGVELPEDKSLGEALTEIVGQSVVGTIAQRPNPNDPTQVFAELRGYAKP
jgi:hypothetical protein